MRKDRMDEQFKKFLELFEQLHINITFVDALTQMPKHAKFLKELLPSKKKLDTLDEAC